jgi:hypothetical protein
MFINDKEILKMAQNKMLPAFKLRGSWRFDKCDMIKFLQKSKNTKRKK